MAGPEGVSFGNITWRAYPLTHFDCRFWSLGVSKVFLVLPGPRLIYVNHFTVRWICITVLCRKLNIGGCGLMDCCCVADIVTSIPKPNRPSPSENAGSKRRATEWPVPTGWDSLNIPWRALPSWVLWLAALFGMKSPVDSVFFMSVLYFYRALFLRIKHMYLRIQYIFPPYIYSDFCYHIPRSYTVNFI